MSSGDYLLRDEPIKATVRKYSMNYSGRLIDNNHYEQLKAKNEQLRQEVEDYKLKETICTDCEAHPEYLSWKKENEQLRKELQQAKDILRKLHCFEYDADTRECVICNECSHVDAKEEHKLNCEYVLLTQVKESAD